MKSNRLAVIFWIAVFATLSLTLSLSQSSRSSGKDISREE